MLFVSPIFLFLFLPFVLGVYFSLYKWRKIQNLFLFLSSILFYFWGEPKFSLFLLVSIFINWFLALLIEKSKRVVCTKLLLILDILFNLGLLFYYKYLDFVITELNSCLSLNMPLKNIILPIGISFFTFQAMSYVIDVYRGKSDKSIEAQMNPLNVGLYISFFPQLIAGPIVRYKTFAKQILYRQESIELFNEGVIRFMTGFSKKILLANPMGAIADRIFSYEANSISLSLAWIGAISYTFQIFFDFSGYSDMAIGLGKIFGFTFEENFDLPYKSTSIKEFWRRWHISLSSWFKDYVYIPLGGNRCGKYRTVINLLIVWILTGFWHGANWTFMMWGLLYFVILLFERLKVVKNFLSDKRLFSHIYVWLVFTLAWVIFRSPNITYANNYIKSMFYNSNIWNDFSFVLIKENIIYFLFAIILSFYSFKHLLNYKNWKSFLLQISIIVFFLISIVYLINNTYNPFIYFNF